MPRKTIHTSKLTCVQVSKQSGNIEVAVLAADKGDAMFASDDAGGKVSFTIRNPKGQGKFEVDKTYELTLVEVG